MPIQGFASLLSYPNHISSSIRTLRIAMLMPGHIPPKLILFSLDYISAYLETRAKKTTLGGAV